MRRGRGFRPWLLALPVVGVAAVCVWFVMTMRAADADYQRALDRAKSVGLIVDVKDLDRLAPDPAQNSAYLYPAVFAKVPPDRYAMGYDEKRYPAECLAWARSVQPELLRALALPGYYATRKIAPGIIDDSDRVRLWRIQIGLCDAAELEAQKGRRDVCLKYLTQARVVASHIRQIPSLYGWENAIRSEARVQSKAVNIAYRCKDDRATLLALRGLVAKPVELGNMRLNLHLHGIIYRDYRDWLLEDEATWDRDPCMGPAPTEYKLANRLAFGPTGAAAFHLNALADLYEKVPTDPNDWEGLVRVLKSSNRAVFNQNLATRIILDLHPGGFSHMASSVESWHYRPLVAQLAIEILLYRLDHGKLPESLDPFGKLSLDPRNGKPMKTQVTKEGFSVLGIGRDGKSGTQDDACIQLKADGKIGMRI